MKDCKPKYIPNYSNINKMGSEPSKLTGRKLYQEIAVILIYAMTTTWPNLCFIVTKLSQFMSEPYEKHINIAKRILRYIKGTINQQLIFKPIKSTLSLSGFCDADWANSQDRKSITRYGFMISDEGPLISWKTRKHSTRKHSTVALSTCEAEYMSISAATREGKYLTALMKDMLNNEMNYTFTLYCGSQSAIALTKNPIPPPKIETHRY